MVGVVSDELAPQTLDDPAESGVNPDADADADTEVSVGSTPFLRCIYPSNADLACVLRRRPLAAAFLMTVEGASRETPICYLPLSSGHGYTRMVACWTQ